MQHFKIGQAVTVFYSGSVSSPHLYLDFVAT